MISKKKLSSLYISSNDVIDLFDIVWPNAEDAMKAFIVATKTKKKYSIKTDWRVERSFVKDILHGQYDTMREIQTKKKIFRGKKMNKMLDITLKEIIKSNPVLLCHVI